MLTLGVGILIFNLVSFKNAKINENTEQLKNINLLTMMIETEAGTGNYEEVTQSEWPQDGYVFNASLSRCENGGTLSWDNDTKKVIMESNTSDKCYVYFDIYVEPTLAELCAEKTLANCIKENVYSVDGVNGIYYHDGVGTYTNADQEAGDNSYRYSGANPNNYICFGTDVETCPSENLYRIIGIFDDDKDGVYNIKIIKKASIGYNIWSDNDSTYWNENTKPIIYTTLNTNYWNTLSSEWQEKISMHTWKVGGMAFSEANTVNDYYETELGTGQTGYEEIMPVGLMYVSDYGYAASPENWQTALYNYNTAASTDNNWLYSNSTDLTISKQSTIGNYAFRINDNGQVSAVQTRYGSSLTRPSFYLDSNVTLKSGSGSINDPYRLQIT